MLKIIQSQARGNSIQYVVIQPFNESRIVIAIQTTSSSQSLTLNWSSSELLSHRIYYPGCLWSLSFSDGNQSLHLPMVSEVVRVEVSDNKNNNGIMLWRNRLDPESLRDWSKVTSYCYNSLYPPYPNDLRVKVDMHPGKTPLNETAPSVLNPANHRWVIISSSALKDFPCEKTMRRNAFSSLSRSF